MLFNVSVVALGFSRTGTAVEIGVTGRLLGCEGCARVVTFEDAHDLLRLGFRGSGGDLGGDLESVEVEAGLAGVDAAGAKGGEDLGERNLYAAGVLEGGQLEGFLVVACAVIGVQAEIVVEVAVVLAAERGRFALDTGGHDVATFEIHGAISPWVPPGLWEENICFHWFTEGGSRQNSLSKGVSCRIVSAKELGDERSHLE